jgi:nucleosome binding factor SPN SPT16 subunit
VLDRRDFCFVLQEKPTGDFAAAWLAALAASGLQTVYVASGLADTMSVKDEEEVKNVKKAAYLVSSALNNRGFKDIEETIDQEKKVKHSKLSERMEEVISQPTKINVKLKVSWSSRAGACLPA